MLKQVVLKDGWIIWIRPLSASINGHFPKVFTRFVNRSLPVLV